MKKGSQPFSYFEILDACKEADCPVCALGHASANRHLTSLIFDGVNDVRLRATLRESLGYCREHAWLLPDAGESATLGIAIIHRDLLNTIRRRLDESNFGKSSRRDKLKSVVAEAIRLEDATPSTGSRACAALGRRTGRSRSARPRPRRISRATPWWAPTRPYSGSWRTGSPPPRSATSPRSAGTWRTPRPRAT